MFYVRILMGVLLVLGTIVYPLITMNVIAYIIIISLAIIKLIIKGIHWIISKVTSIRRIINASIY